MSFQRSSTLALAVLPALALAGPPLETELKDKDHKSLGKEVRAYFDALEEVKGIQESFSELAELIEKTQKKLKGADLLSFVGDWEQVFYQARLAEYKDGGKKGKVDERSTSSASGEDIEYAIRVPAKYRAKDGPYPLVLSIPDAGVAPAEHLEADWTDAGGDAAVVVAVGMPEDTARWRAFDPTGPLDGVATIMFTFGDVLNQFAVDVNRVFLAGNGAGNGAAFSCAEAFPHLFAGVACRGEVPEGDPTNFRGVATLFLSGGDNVGAFEERAKELGFENCTRQEDGSEAAIWGWMGEVSRESYPDHVSFSPRNPYSTRAYWIGLEGADVEAGPLVEAKVDREANTIEIQAEKVSELRLYLNDALVDMERPVTVTVNGARNEQLVQRNLRTMVELVRSFGGDWGRVFTATWTVSVPAKE